jgi:tetratricopeptide (TPR) repeat protein
MAYARLGTAYSNLNLTEQAGIALKKAYALRDRVSQLEKLYIETHYYDIVAGDYEKAAEDYRLWQQIYPNDVVPYANLAKIYDLLGQHEKNLEELLQAQRLDPNLSSMYSNLANAYVCLNRIQDAKNVLAQSEARHLSTPMFWEVRYQLAFLSGNPAEIDREFATSMSLGEDGVLALQADTEAYYGRLAKAREFTRRAVEASRRDHDAESAVGDEVVGALREADFGNISEARRQIAAALAEHPDARSRALAALIFARTGQPRAALAIVRELQRQFPSDTLMNGYWLPTVLAAIRLRDNPSRAVEILDAATPYELGLPQTPTNTVPYPIYVRGLAFLAAGQGAKAAEEFKKIIDYPGIVGNYPLGALARLGLARAYALQAGFPANRNCEGQSEKCFGSGEPTSRESLATAVEKYRDFLSLWKDADSGIPLLQQARAEFEKLPQSGAATF